MGPTNWNQETKARLNERVTANINDIGSLARHVIRSSKSTDLLAQAAKNFASQESVINSSHESVDVANDPSIERMLDLIGTVKKFCSSVQLEEKFQDSMVRYSSHCDMTELLLRVALNLFKQTRITLKKMNAVRAQFEFQQSAIERSMSSIEEIQDQLKTIQR